MNSASATRSAVLPSFSSSPGFIRRCTALSVWPHQRQKVRAILGDSTVSDMSRANQPSPPSSGPGQPPTPHLQNRTERTGILKAGLRLWMTTQMSKLSWHIRAIVLKAIWSPLYIAGTVNTDDAEHLPEAPSRARKFGALPVA